MKIVILAGEVSGDNYGAFLAENLKKIDRKIEIYGTGGKKMESSGVEILERIPFGKMGYLSILKDIRRYWFCYKSILKKIRKIKPDLIIFIDNPGFNLKILKAIGKDIPSFYYIPPKIWAHNYSRIKILRFTKGVIPIFPFEVDIYRKENIPCYFFGHPVTDIIDFDCRKEEILNEIEIKDNIPVIGILPGSRKEEVEYLLPVFIRIIEILKKKHNIQAVFSAVNGEISKIEKRIMRRFKVSYPIWEKSIYPFIKSSDLILSASGTVNLEIALLKKPFIVFYKTSPLNYLIAKSIVKLKFISPVNIIFKREIVPEFVQKIPYKEVIDKIEGLLEKKKIFNQQMEYFEKLKEILKEKDVSERISLFLVKECLRNI